MNEAEIREKITGRIPKEVSQRKYIELSETVAITLARSLSGYHVEIWQGTEKENVDLGRRTGVRKIAQAVIAHLAQSAQ